VICNIVRYRSTVQLWRNPPAARGLSFFASNKRAVVYDRAMGALDGAARLQAAAAELRSAGFRVAQEELGGNPGLYADRGFLKKWALVLLHFAILVLLGGGIYGRATGSQGNVRLADGETTTLTLDRSENKVSYIQPVLKLLAPLNYELNQTTFRIDYDKKIELPQELLENTPPELQEYYLYFVRDYVSQLSAKYRSKTASAEVKVNHPLVIEKLILYQSGYQQDGYLKVRWAGSSESRDYRILPDQTCALTRDGLAVFDDATGQWLLPKEGEDGRFLVLPRDTPLSGLRYRFELVKAGDLYENGRKTRYIGPLTICNFYDGASNQYLGSQLIDQERGFESSVAGVAAHCSMSARVDNYSIFSYNRDPGKPVLYFGWVCMILGVAFTLYISFSQLWLRAEGDRVYLLALGPLAKSKSELRRKLHVILGGGPAAQHVE
jgi:cytochrome c biogenesis protein ResB